jgi:transcriptional regulator with XRE-family HTH domain
VKTPEERGVIGEWARRCRTERNLSPDEVAHQLLLRGHKVTVYTLRAIESGAKKPGRALLDALAAFYQTRPPNEEAVAIPTDTLDRIAIAMEEQARQAKEQAFALNGILATLLAGSGEPVDEEARTVLVEWQEQVAPRLSAVRELPRPADPPTTVEPRSP